MTRRLACLGFFACLLAAACAVERWDAAVILGFGVVMETVAG